MSFRCHSQYPTWQQLNTETRQNLTPSSRDDNEVNVMHEKTHTLTFSQIVCSCILTVDSLLCNYVFSQMLSKTFIGGLHIVSMRLENKPEPEWAFWSRIAAILFHKAWEVTHRSCSKSKVKP